MADRRSIEVYGLPSFLSDDDYIRDRLLLHFLRPKNGGGDVDVHYPTEEEGAALLVFEDEKVAERILSRRHNLIIEDYVYPLEVRRPQPRESMFSGPVRTSLVLSYFSNFWEVTKLLEQHGLRIYHYNDSVLGIEGDFTDLKRCHLDLNRILCRQNPVEKHNSLESTASNRSPSEGRRASDSVSTVPELKLPLLSHVSRRPPKEGEHIGQDRRPPKGDHMTQDRRPPKEGEHIGQDRRPPKGDHMTQDRRPPKGDHMTQDRRPSEGDHMTQDRRPPKEGEHMSQDRRPPKEREHMTEDRRPPKEREHMTEDRRPPKEGEHIGQDNITRDNLSPTQRSSTNQGAQKSSTKPARSSTPTQFQNVPSPPGLFQSFLVDPAVHTYVRTFGQETINNFIRNNNIDMKDKDSDGFTSITLTSLTPAQPERFDKTCLLLKELFDHYQNRLRVENITLPTDPMIPNEEMTRKIQRYLLDLRICSLPVDDNTLSVMGLSNKVLMFMQEWKETGGQLVHNMIGEAAGSVSSHSPTVGMDKKDLATSSKNSTQHMVQDRRAPKEGEHLGEDRCPPKEHMREDRRPPKEEDMTQDRRPPKEGEHMREDRRPPKEGEHMAQDNITRDNLSPTQRSSTNQGAQKSSTKPARSSTPTQFQNVPSPQALSQSFLVDPAVHTYVRIFLQEKINRFLRQYNINMKDKDSDGFTSITLTSLTPAQPEDFDKTCSILKEFFVRYQNHLREENITLPTDPRIPNEEMTRKIQWYLLKHDIYSLPVDDNTLSIIGPSENVLVFMQEWKGTRGQLVHNMIGEAAGSVSYPSPTVGMDNNDLATKRKKSTQHMVQDRRPPKEGEHMAQGRRPPKEGEHMTEDRRPPKEGEHMAQGRRPPKDGEHMTEDRRPPKEGEHMAQDRRPPNEREDMTQERRSPKEEDMTQDNITRDNLSPTQRSFTNQGAQKSSTKPARSSTPTRFQNVPSPRALSQSFLVDPAVHTYVRIFVQEKIDRFLRQYNIDMKDKYSDGFISITLTSLTPVQPERFDKTCLILKEFFVRYQNRLREENITLPTDPRIPNEEMTRKMQLYLLKHNINSLPKDDNTLSIIGPSENILMFMQEWKENRGQLVHNIIGEAAGSVSSPSPMVGMDKKDLATKSKNSTQHMVQDRKPPKDEHMREDIRPPKEGEHLGEDRCPPKEHMAQGRRPPKEGEHLGEDRRPPKEGEHMALHRRPPKEGEDMTEDNITRDNFSPTQRSSTNQGTQKSSTKPARSSTPTRFQNVPSPRALSQSFLVDPAVHTYVRIFLQEKIDRFLRQYNINMKDKDSDDFISITLTSLTPAQPEDFDKTCSMLKEFFDGYQNRLREETITLPTDPRIPNEEMTRKIQRYLLKHDIYSLPKDDNTLSIIGPSENVLMFMQEWKETRGQLVHNMIGEAAGSVSSPSPTVGLDNNDLATKSKNSTQHMAQDRRPPKEGEHMREDRRPPKKGEHLGEDRCPPKEHMAQDRRPPKEGDHMTQDNITRDNLSPTQRSSTNQGAQKTSTKPARSSTPTRFQNVPSPRALSQSFLVDPAVYTYVRIFLQEEIDRFLRQYNINMKDKDSDGFISITLTSLTPAQPEDFDKTCLLLKEFFDGYQNRLREETITLPTDPRIPNEEMTKRIQRYLLKHHIYSSPKDDNTLSIIGPSENVLMFMQEWKGTRGQLVHNMIGETAGSVSSPSPTVGMDKNDLATKSKNSTKPTASDGRARGRQGRQEAHDRGRDRQQGGPSSSRGKSPARHTREPWR